MSPEALYLRFGIPSLDRLITGHADGTWEPNKLPTGIILGEEGSKSITLIGPDGTGKSVLSLHLASRYAADCWERRKAKHFVLYVSTGLNFEAALGRAWQPFGLDKPGTRHVPFARLTSYQHSDHKPVELIKINPFENMAEFLLSDSVPTNSYGQNTGTGERTKSYDGFWLWRTRRIGSSCWLT